MSKELRALERIETFLKENCKHYKQDIGYIKQALQRLESIDNANPNEALKRLNKVNNYLNDVYDYKEIKEEVRKDIDTIKQKLINKQEQEKVLEIIFKKRVDINGLKKCIELDLPLTDEQRLHKYNHDYMMIGMEQLTIEEFDLLKRYCNENI